MKKARYSPNDGLDALLLDETFLKRMRKKNIEEVLLSKDGYLKFGWYIRGWEDCRKTYNRLMKKERKGAMRI